MLVILSHLLPVVYYTLLFLLLFEWVLERLSVDLSVLDYRWTDQLVQRRHFNKKAEQLLRTTKRIAIIFCDIDNFKKLNDTQGHHKADGVLKQVADIIREETAGIGAAGRYGGEDFRACSFPRHQTGRSGGNDSQPRRERNNGYDKRRGKFSREGTPVEEVVKQADEMMYQSKTSGKNKVSLHPSLKSSRSRSSEDSSKQKAQVK